MKEKLKPILAEAKKDPQVLAVIFYGSAARKELHRDVDVCIVLTPSSYTEINLSQTKLKYASLASEGVDVSVFQQLPLYVRVRVVAEGKVLYASDLPALFDLAVSAHRAFEDYKPIYETYMEGVAHG